MTLPTGASWSALRIRRAQRDAVLRELQQSLTDDEVNTLLGRKQGLENFETHIGGNWSESQWQDFFDREQWVFGYGLDYRIMRQFSREATVGAGGTDNQNKPVTDFLMTFTEYTVLVEIKRPCTAIFKQTKKGRAGTWEFTADFTSAVSQILEQKAEWSSFAESGEHYDKADRTPPRRHELEMRGVSESSDRARNSTAR